MRKNERAMMQAAAQNVGELLHVTQAEVRAYRAELAAYRAEVQAGRAEILGEIRRISDSMGFIEVDVAEMLKREAARAPLPAPIPTVGSNGDHLAITIEEFED